MKLVCAWCKKVIRDGPGKTVSHGVCPECARRVTRQRELPACRMSPAEERVDGVFFLALLAGLLLLAATLLSEGLHWASGGKIPRLIQWEQSQPSPTVAPSPPHRRRAR